MCNTDADKEIWRYLKAITRPVQMEIKDGNNN